MRHDNAETFLILKYGSMQRAYEVWVDMLPAGQWKEFTTPEYAALAEYEYNSVYGFGPIDDRR